MNAEQTKSGVDGGSAEWRAAVLEVERACQEYARALAASDHGETEVDIMWLRLWRSERRRDELARL